MSANDRIIAFFLLLIWVMALCAVLRHVLPRGRQRNHTPALLVPDTDSPAEWARKFAEGSYRATFLPAGPVSTYTALMQQVVKTRLERDTALIAADEALAGLKKANDELQQALARVDELEHEPTTCLECGFKARVRDGMIA